MTDRPARPYRDLLELVAGDEDLVALLVEEGEITITGDRATIDLDRVLVARTLVRELEVPWPAAEIILRLRAELIAARKRIAELELRDAHRHSASTRKP